MQRHLVIMVLIAFFGTWVMFSINDHRYGFAAALFMCFLAGLLEILFNTQER